LGDCCDRIILARPEITSSCIPILKPLRFVSPSHDEDIVTNRIRVLVVDDSSTQRQMLVALISADPEFEVVGTADSGERAIQQASALMPDVITMDLRMTGMDGLSASQAITARFPIPILMVTASVSRDDQRLIAKAFSAGILAIVAKPSVHATENHDEFRRMVKGVSRVKLVRRREITKHNPPPAPATKQLVPPLPIEQRRKPRLSYAVMPAHVKRIDVIGIASSTGGPQVLEKILTKLPADFPVPVLIVQHIASGFASSLGDWLRPLCALPVRIVEPSQPVVSGIWIADRKHLVVRDGKFGVSLEPPVTGHCPSGTVLFQSLAQEYGAAALGVILTGMGEDGAIGLRALHDAGGVTVAQDEESSVIHGMPGAAIALGAADFALPPVEITRAILEFAKRGRD
jgi:two-component system, chemotaxis family, protein-glutamate methylesterase/glutaminase